MMQGAVSLTFIDHEARSLLTRLDQVKRFSLLMPMVPAASIAPEALRSIEDFLSSGGRLLRQKIFGFIGRLRHSKGNPVPPAEAQRRYSLLRLEFNNILSQVDIFADVLNQRSEHDTGVWLSGLDAVARDALTIAGGYYEIPPAICYLDRGHGAAIRRARTRLPGGVPNPVAIIRVPRERMIGSGIASSLIHEVGHQGSALLDLVRSIRPVLKGLQTGSDRLAWQLWERWISEIISDFWSVAKIGIASTQGLIGVVSLPKAFVFRFTLDDPHPFPWIRVKLSCAIGDALYPHPQWKRLSVLWDSLYPLTGLPDERMQVVSLLMSSMPGFVTLLANHRPRSLRGRSLMEAIRCDKRRPQQLQILYESWRSSPQKMLAEKPSLVFAAIGQAKADGRITPERESRMLSEMLKQWALKNPMDVSAVHLKQSLCGPGERKNSSRHN